MKQNTIITIVAIIVIAIVSVIALSRKQEEVPVIQSNNTTNERSPSQESPSFNRAQVMTHSTASDCYTIVGTNVYDVTSWITKHPGGKDAILGLCGKDGTEQFSLQHGTSAKAQAALASFLIGTINN
jgi:cytochrome b involved in lipid metabolism